MAAAAQQIEGQRQAASKWPTLSLRSDYLYPPKLNREQSSSEAAALYKAELAARWGVQAVVDLTGGMGVDCLFFAQTATAAHYCERDAALCEAERENFEALGATNITCHAGDSLEWLRNEGPAAADLLYIDPARRDAYGRKVAAFEACEPNLLPNLDFLSSRCRRLLIKASPMIDITAATAQLGLVDEVHVVAVRNECKEVLFVLRGRLGPTAEAAPPAMGTAAAPDCPVFHCVNLSAAGSATPRQEEVFTPAEEAEAAPRFATAVQEYLYEPNTALMKGGCFNLVCQRYGTAKLARNTHLYTHAELLPHFPGRIFHVLQPLPLNAREAAKALPERKAHVATRNFPMAAAALQRKLGLTEGGRLFVIAATLGSKPQAWLCDPM